MITSPPLPPPASEDVAFQALKDPKFQANIVDRDMAYEATKKNLKLFEKVTGEKIPI